MTTELAEKIKNEMEDRVKLMRQICVEHIFIDNMKKMEKKLKQDQQLRDLGDGMFKK